MITGTELKQKFEQDFSWLEKQVASHPMTATIIIVALGVLEVFHIVRAVI